MPNQNDANRGSKRVTRAVAGVLTIAFLGLVFTAFGAMMLHDGRDIIGSARKLTALQPYLPEKWNQLDLLQARVSSFTAKISDVMWGKREMGYVNSGFQYALGKRVVNTGASNMIRLNTGHFYDLMQYKDLRPNAEEIAALRKTTLKDTPFLFVYEHPTLYDPDRMMPADYAPLDHSAQMAEEAVAALRAEGVEVMDSREVLNGSGVPLDDLLMFTDQHWSTRAAITMAQAIARRVNDMTGAGLDAGLLDMDRFDTVVHEKLFLGKYGQRLGPRLATPDDIIEYNPKYPTHLIRDTKRVVSLEHEEGTFPEVAVREDRLLPDPGKTYNVLAYTYYGQVESYNNFTNPDAPDFTILLLKDSYSAPIGTFLSLLARNVLTVDLRRDVDPLETWLENYKPDVVVMAYSLQMLRDDEYEFGA